MKTFLAICAATKADLSCRHPRCMRQQFYENWCQAMFGLRYYQLRFRNPY